MANEQNLLPGGSYVFTDADRRKATAARLENLSKRRAFREAFESLLSMEIKTTDGRTLTGVEAIALRTFQQALDGNLEAFKIIRDSVGEKPAERIMLAEVHPDVIEEVERAVIGGDEDEEAAL